MDAEEFLQTGVRMWVRGRVRQGQGWEGGLG